MVVSKDDEMTKCEMALLVMGLVCVALLSGCGGGTQGVSDSSGSRAEVNTVSAVVSPAQSGLLGDMDGDGAPTVGDVIKILRIVVGLDPEDECADANENETIDVGDAIKVLRCVVGLDDWPIGECGEEDWAIFCVRFPDDTYVVEAFKVDPEHLLQSVQLSGTAGSTPLTWNLYPFHPGEWWTDPNLECTPSFPQYYTMTCTTASGTYTVNKTVTTWEWAQ